MTLILSTLTPACRAKDSSPPMAQIQKMHKVPAVVFTILLLIVVCLLFELGNRNFLSPYNINTILGFAAILLMAALAQMSAILVGGIDLSVGGLMSLISVVFTLLIKPMGYWPTQCAH
jgi:ribose transport system permease protein